MTRKAARELCMKLLFEMHINQQYDINILNNYFEDEEVESLQREYIYNIIKNSINHIKEINLLIEKYAIGWTLDRIANVDLAILQLALVEILYNEEIPYNVSINEAVEIAKKYSGDNSPSFINGILGKFIKKEGIKKDD